MVTIFLLAGKKQGHTCARKECWLFNNQELALHWLKAWLGALVL